METTDELLSLYGININIPDFCFGFFLSAHLDLLTEEELRAWKEASAALTLEKQTVCREISTRAYHSFLHKIGVNHIASTHTIRKWFGIPKKTLPSRESIFRLGLSLLFSPEEIEKFLQQGIGECGFQINDYREIVFFYCSIKHYSYAEALHYIEKFEQGMSSDLKLLEHNDTEKLFEQFYQVKQCHPDEFLQWMLEKQEYFKGYSLTALSLFRTLQTAILEKIHVYAESQLKELLHETRFYYWQGEKQAKDKDFAKQVRQFAEGQKGISLSEQEAGNILEYLKIFNVASDSHKELLLELYASFDKELTEEQRKWLHDTLHITLLDLRYLSEIFSTGRQNQKKLDLLLLTAQLKKETLKKRCPAALRKKAVQIGYPSSGYASVKQVLTYSEKAYAEQKRRCRSLRRSDMLIMILYCVQMNYYMDTDEKNSYKQDDAKRLFCKMADDVLRTCHMHPLSPECFAMDAVFLNCFGKEEMYSFADILEIITCGQTERKRGEKEHE